MSETLSSAVYQSMGPASRPPWVLLAATSIAAAASGAFATYSILQLKGAAMAADGTRVRTLSVRLASLPAPCVNWEVRCRAGASAAEGQGLGRFWSPALCAEASAARLSCANRAAAWLSASVAQVPSAARVHDEPETLSTPMLFLFLPGTGTPSGGVSSLLDAATDMGYHALSLSCMHAS